MVLRRKLLVIGTYPIVIPRHGGQKRVSALVGCYKQIFREVRYVSFLSSLAYGEHEASSEDIFSSPELANEIKSNPLFEDVMLGLAAKNDAYFKKIITRLLTSYKPDCIIFEQPFMYAGFKEIMSELNIRVPVIYSSQNVELQLKKQLYNSADTDRKLANEFLEIVEETEKELVRNSSLTICVTEQDEQYFKQLGARKTVLIKNGINLLRPRKSSVDKWNKVLRSSGAGSAIFFAGSSHTPNYMGFDSLVGTRLGYLNFSQKIVLVGGIVDLLKIKVAERHKHLSGCFWNKIVPAGGVDDESLAAILENTSLVILPISSGGGSNLKTAEALLSGKNVLGTSIAFRGYEEYKKFTNVYIEDDPERFKSQITSLANKVPEPQSELEKNQLKELTWPGRLTILASQIKESII